MSKSIYTIIGFALMVVLAVSSCSISYTFNAATIDYSKTKTISITPFPNMAMLVNPLLSNMLTEEIEDRFITRTKLEMVRSGGDLTLEGEITGYGLTPINAAPTDDNRVLASQTRLTITIRVRYENRANPEKDDEFTFSAYRDFPSDQTFQSVESELCEQIVEELVDQIYNSTIADW